MGAMGAIGTTSSVVRISYLTSLYTLLFKNIAYVESFQHFFFVFVFVFVFVSAFVLVCVFAGWSRFVLSN